MDWHLLKTGVFNPGLTLESPEKHSKLQVGHPGSPLPNIIVNHSGTEPQILIFEMAPGDSNVQPQLRTTDLKLSLVE